MELLIVRHAESQGNATGDYSTLSSDELSQQGRAQALALARSLRPLAFDQIIVSPLVRAVDTLIPYLEQTGQQAVIWPEIAEIPKVTGLVEPSTDWKSEPAYLTGIPNDHLRFLNDQAIKPAAQAPHDECLCRVHRAYERICAMQNDDGPNVLMVTHGHFISELMNLFLATSRRSWYSHHNCHATLLKGNEDWCVEFSNRPCTILGRQAVG